MNISEINEKIDNFIEQRALYFLYLKNTDHFFEVEKL